MIVRLPIQIDTDLAILTLNRPEQRNALNYSMWRSIPELIDKAAVTRQCGSSS